MATRGYVAASVSVFNSHGSGVFSRRYCIILHGGFWLTHSRLLTSFCTLCSVDSATYLWRIYPELRFWLYAERPTTVRGGPRFHEGIPILPEKWGPGIPIFTASPKCPTQIGRDCWTDSSVICPLGGSGGHVPGKAARDRNVSINCACAERKGNSPHTRVFSWAMPIMYPCSCHRPLWAVII